jgi:CBS domain containing-hemolysin-like protein
MRQDVLRVDARLTLDEVLKRMEETQQRLAAVFDGEVYLGLVSVEDISEAQVILGYLARRVERPGVAPAAQHWPLPHKAGAEGPAAP